MGAAGLVALALLVMANAPVGAQPAGIGASTCPVLDLGNPVPGAQVSGNLIVSGVAFSPVGAAITHVDFFLGPRDTGGQIIGSTMPDADTHMFQTTLALPDVDRGDNLVVYAYTNGSAVTTLMQPITIGSPPKTTGTGTPTPVPSSITTKTGCPTANLAASRGVQTGITTAPVVSIRPAQGPRLVVGNPNAYDTIPHGTYLSYGIAVDTAASNGAGVDAVNYFLGNRDTGGVRLGGVTPSPDGTYIASLVVPDNTTGGNLLYVYAVSGVNGREAVVVIPVNVGVPPKATRIPTAVPQ
jgi:hypothetical protein